MTGNTPEMAILHTYITWRLAFISKISDFLNEIFSKTKKIFTTVAQDPFREDIFFSFRGSRR